MKNRQGLTLVETLISITILSVLSAAAASLMLSAINIREASQKSLQAEQFVKRVFEKHKDFWSIKENYELIPEYSFTSQFLEDFPEDISLVIEYSCLNTSGTILDSDGSTLNCIEPSPPLRRVEVSILQGENIIAQQKADIGKPVASRSH